MTTPDAPPVRLGAATDRERVVETVVAAFAADPAFAHFFPGSYAEDAPVFAGNLYDARLATGTVWVVEDGSAVAMWDPPGAPSVDVTAGLTPAARDRLDRYDALVHAVMPTEPHWYLGVLATHPARAGRRWGRAVMAPGLDRARADGLPAYLETATAANEAIYVASGWTLTATVTVDDLAMRVMRR